MQGRPFEGGGGGVTPSGRKTRDQQLWPGRGVYRIIIINHALTSVPQAGEHSHSHQPPETPALPAKASPDAPSKWR